jgi:type II secretory pathway component PulF
LVLGGFDFVQQAIALLVVYPKMNVLYEDFGAELPLSTKMYPYVTGVVILVLIGVVEIGWKLIRGRNPSNKLFRLGVTAL